MLNGPPGGGPSQVHSSRNFADIVNVFVALCSHLKGEQNAWFVLTLGELLIALQTALVDIDVAVIGRLLGQFLSH